MRLRLILSFALIVLVSVTGVALIARQGSASAVRAYMFGGGMLNVDDLVDSLQKYYAEHSSWQGVDDLLKLPGSGYGSGQGHGQGGPHGMMMNQRLRLADEQGNVLVDTSVDQAAGQLVASELAAAMAIKSSGRTVGYLLVEGGMGFNHNDETYLVERLTQAALTAGLIAGGLSLLLALGLAYTLLRPVQALTRAANRLGQGDLSQRVHVSGSDELAGLGATFNRMADSLQQAEESRRAMTADIAHELRTPLAVQRANLEALQDGVYPLSAENLQSVLEQNMLLTRLVDDLRTLALAESGQLQLERTPTDLPALVERTAGRFRSQADSRQVDLRVNTPSAVPAPLMLDPMRIEQILGNLISNALRYTPQGGSIVLDTTRASNQIQVQVHDSGPGIAPEALPHVFKRFYRADRSRNRQEGGSGLGLAIARQLAEAHGGSLTAANHPQGGAVFTLSLPAQQFEPE
ncbi:MAG: HAMP domain-containing protein [Anaerolineales bacterium]|nr:HAMP domain-containing protein [Anaerolineales bacterium]